MTKQLFENQIYCYSDMMYRFALKLLANTDDAKDTVQNVMIKLWNMRESLDNISNVKAYAMQMVKNESLNRQKQQQTIAGHHTAISKTLSVSIVNNYGNYTSIIQNLIAELPPKQRMVLHLRDVEEYEIDEIAKVVEIDENAVRVNLARARQKIREELLKISAYEEQQLSRTAR